MCVGGTVLSWGWSPSWTRSTWVDSTTVVSVRATPSIERTWVISRIRQIDGVARTETLVVLSTHVERTQLAVQTRETEPPPQAKRGRRNGNSQLRRA